MPSPCLIKTIKERFRGFLPVVVDLETSGFNPRRAALLQVAMMTVKMDERGMLLPDEMFSAEIRPFPDAVIEEANIRFTGIDPFDESRGLEDEKIALVRMFKAVSKKIKQAECKKAILVGHNGSFDLGFINAAVDRIGYKRNPFHPFSVLDTASLSGLVLGQTVLARACFAAGIDFDESLAHNAAYDTQMECELFCALVNRYTKFAGFPPPLPPDAEERLERQRQNRATLLNQKYAAKEASATVMPAETVIDGTVPTSATVSAAKPGE